MNQLTPENVHLVSLVPPVSLSSSSSFLSATTTYISLKNYMEASIVFLGGVITGAATLKFRQAVNISGSSQKALSVDGMWDNATALGSASTPNDTFAHTVYSSGSSSQSTGTVNNTVKRFPIRASQLDVANGFDCIGVGVAKANALFGVFAILKGRYPQEVQRPSLQD